MKLVPKEKLLLQNIAYEWNSQAKECSSLIIPPASLCDEIKTNIYGMIIIELLYLSGILIHTVSDMEVESRDLVKGWKQRTLYLCMDGLSLDMHRSFQKKLIKLPYSYKKY